MKQQFMIVLGACVLAGTACKKDNGGNDHPIEKASLILTPATQYMPLATMDSAVLVWQTASATQKVKLQAKEQQLVIGLDTLTEGNGTLKVEVYSGIIFGNQYRSVWVQQQQLTISHTQAVNIAGPSAFKDAQWFPRVLLKDGVGHAATVALRPEDPYFLVRNLPANVAETVVSRAYYDLIGGIRQVAGGEWSCKSGCTGEDGHILNTTFFNFLPQQLGNKPWNHVEVDIMYIDNPVTGGGYGLSMTYSL